MSVLIRTTRDDVFNFIMPSNLIHGCLYTHHQDDVDSELVTLILSRGRLYRIHQETCQF